MTMLIEVVAAWFLADLMCGVVHWAEDRYLTGRERWGFLRGLAADNIQHHNKPTAMLLLSPWSNIRDSVMIAAPAAIALAVCGAPLWLWLSVAFASLGNLTHRWAHTPIRQLPWVIVALQLTGIISTPWQHNEHHRSDGRLVSKSQARGAYCPMTDWLNPILDRVHVWDFAEWSLGLFGIRTVDERELA